MLAAAADTLATTSGVDLTLSTDDLPEGVSGITEADGIATDAPAFEGTITVVFAGQSVDVPVIAVDGVVYAQLPFTTGYQDIDPGDYGAPDPAALVSEDDGLRLACWPSPRASRRARASAAAPTTPRSSPPTPAPCPARR